MYLCISNFLTLTVFISFVTSYIISNYIKMATTQKGKSNLDQGLESQVSYFSA